MDVEGFQRAPKRHIQDLNIVPILDMLTTVIFFLLLSTSFMEYTKLTLPPSQTATITDPMAPPPLAPKLILAPVQEGIKAVLFWAGEDPGELLKVIEKSEVQTQRRKMLMESVRELVKDFLIKYPKEKTIQLGLGSQLNYQDLISAMDAVAEKLPDIVLISPEEAEARIWKTH